MKKFLFLAALATTMMAHAQTITIGDGSDISNQAPVNTLYNYSLTEHLFLANEIEFAGNIKAIRFHIAYSYSSEHTFDIDVYMKHVSKEAFSDPTDIETFSPTDKVYSGPWTIPANTDGWMTIDFDTPFAYNGNDNLLIGIDENSDDFAIRYFMYTAANNSVLSYFSDDQNPNPCDLSSFTGFKEMINQRPNIKLVFGGIDGIVENSPNVLGIYTNPVKDLLYINSADQETVSIYDATGRLVMQETYTGPLNISSLKNGLYIVTTSKGVMKLTK